MPTIPTYITDEDFEAYMKIKKNGRSAWTEFIHEALAFGIYGSNGDNNPETENKPIKTPQLSNKVIGGRAIREAKENLKSIKSPKDAERATSQLNAVGGENKSQINFPVPISKSFSARKKSNKK